jgi:hypothetical protein
MQYIGFDVGLRNLGYCVIYYDAKATATIQDIDCIDLGPSKNIQTITDSTIEALDHMLYNILDISKPITVLIESQMTSVMKAVQNIINTYFRVCAKYQNLDLRTSIVSPSCKLNLIQCYPSYKRPETSKAKSQYQKNKLDALDFGEWLLLHSQLTTSEQVMAKLMQLERKTDVMDAFLMTMAIINKQQKHS